MKQRTRTVVGSVLAGGLGSSLAACDAIKDIVDPEPECCFNPPPPPPPTPTPAVQKYPVIDEGELPTDELPALAEDDWHGSAIDFGKLHSINGRTPEGQVLYRTRGACYITVPSKVPQRSWQPPDVAPASCTEEMAGFLWSQCYGGTLYADEEGKVCVCTEDGNPPPPPRYVHCPPEAAPKPDAE